MLLYRPAQRFGRRVRNAAVASAALWAATLAATADPDSLARALQPFPVPVRTLDAIHLAALEFIRAQKQSVQLASYDERLRAAARFLGIAEWSESQ